MELSDVERMVDDWERNAVEKSQRYQAMQQQVEQISITESVAGGAVSVTVGNNGIPTNVAMTEGVRKMSPDEIAANVLKAMQKAQSKYPQKIQEIVAATVGDDDTTRHIVETAVDNFPPAPEEPEEPVREAAPRQLQVETEADDEPAPPRRPTPPRPSTPPPATRRRPSSDDDDGEDFGDQTFLRRD
ncbi:YbaB/EbfC family nucleoid-associated protein [Amycolatopsis anabasis]|uniref:YbaB/EbfC family nucleoid-associated protein n=1 Tax=Amycolatopsis anabasis TaxID=1840409 RepID=UPI001FE79B8E|nr:YbaB/EbfC family nucleoid-associated protein [Amycolatopsis anabasis]